MFDFSTIRKGIVIWLEAQSSLTAIRLDQNAAKPDDSHFQYRMTSIVKVGEDYVGRPNDNGLASVYGNRDFTCQIQGFGAGTVEKAEVLRDSLSNPIVHNTLRESKIIVFDSTPVVDITGLDETEFEERSSFDVFMRSEMVLSGVDVGKIEIVNGTATYTQPGKDDITENITIDSTI